MNDLDLDLHLLQSGLAADAAHMTKLIISGQSLAADAHLKASNYDARLKLWQAHR